MYLNLKSGHVVLWSYLRSVVGFVGIWESCKLFQIIVGRVGKS